LPMVPKAFQASGASSWMLRWTAAESLDMCLR
jgi:hypothetical protein